MPAWSILGTLMSWFGALTLAGWLTVVITAGVIRGRPFAMFVGVLVGIYSLVAAAMAPWFAAVLPVFVAFHAVVYVNFLALARPRMRPLVYRLLVSWPASFFTAGTLLAMPWAVLTAVGLHPWAPWLPYALAAVGMLQSLTTKRDEIDIVVSGPAGPARRSSRAASPRQGARGAAAPHRPDHAIRTSARSCRSRVCGASPSARSAAKPDLVFLTGDFLTMESQQRSRSAADRARAAARDAGEGLRLSRQSRSRGAGRGRARALEERRSSCSSTPSATSRPTPGRCRSSGMDFEFRDRAEHLASVCAEHPRKPGMLRIVLLHDPGAFRHLPPGEGDLVLSGHTHGGQVGLLSLGLPWTFLRLFGDKIPDHGFWARGTDRMYVHRGTGHYGFPLRLGVPAEESLVRVHRAV